MTRGQDIIDFIRFKILKLKRKKRNNCMKLYGTPPKSTTKAIKKNVVAVSGYYYSGSSVVADLLTECTGITNYRSFDVYNPDKASPYCFEVTFFTQSGSLFDLAETFYNNESEEDNDLAIKRFLSIAQNFNCEFKQYPKCKLYDETFLKITDKFIENIVELDEPTKEYMKDKHYPYFYTDKEDIYPNCSFMSEKGYRQYIFYRFKKITKYEFNVFVANYLYEFFEHISDGQDIVVCDQLCSMGMILEKFNFFMNENPVKEITVWRDPRDQYFSIIRGDFPGYAPHKADKFVGFYRNNCLPKLNNKIPNRLDIRFEDAVLDYENFKDKVFTFIGLDEKNHINKKRVFNPDISKVNIGAWEKYHNQRAMKLIGQELKAYCYEINKREDNKNNV